MVEQYYKLSKMIRRLDVKTISSSSWHALRLAMNTTLPAYYAISKPRDGVPSSTYLNQDVIVSLTSFPARIKTIKPVLESLLRQTVRPTKIILWLANEQFPDKKALYNYLKSYTERGVEISFCDDLKSHKKYYYTMIENPNACVITVDDDIFYSELLVERLLKTYLKNPNCIVTQRAHYITLDNVGKPKPYNDWIWLAKDMLGPDYLLLPTGGAGTLFFPGAISEKAFDKELIKKLCFFADDIWLKCMSLLNDTSVVMTDINNPEVIGVYNNIRNGLAKKNVEENLNDVQIKQVTEYFDIDWTAY